MSSNPLTPLEPTVSPLGPSDSKKSEGPDFSRPYGSMIPELTLRRCLPLLSAGVAAVNLVAFREMFVVLRGDELLALVCAATAGVALGIGLALPVGWLRRTRLAEACWLFLVWLTALAAPAGLAAACLLSPEVVGAASAPTPLTAFTLSALVSGPMNLTAGWVIAMTWTQCFSPTSYGGRNESALLMLGFTLGAGAVAFLFGDQLSPLQVVLCVSILFLTVAAITSWRLASSAVVMTPIIWVTLFAAVIVSCVGLSEPFNSLLERKLFGSHVLEIHRSVTGVITLWKRGQGVGICHNRVPVAFRGASEANAQVLQTAHIPLLLHPEPQKVLLLGGSDPRLIREMSRQPVQLLHHVALDDVLQQVFASNVGHNELAAWEPTKLISQRGEADARNALRNLDVSFDVILVDIPPPTNTFVNRFYTYQFFTELKVLLNAGGLIAVRLTRPPWGRYTQHVLGFSSVLRTFSRVFSSYILAGSETTLCIASLSREPLPTDVAVLRTRRAERHLDGLLEDALKPGLLRKGPSNGFWGNPRTNRDLRPVTGFLLASGWIMEMPDTFRRKALYLLLLDLETVAFLLGALGLLAAVATIVAPRHHATSNILALLIGTFAAGATACALVVGDQCVFGTIYRDSGLLATGLFLGATSGAVIMMARRGDRFQFGPFIGGFLLLIGVAAAMVPQALGHLVKITDSALRTLHGFLTVPLFAALIGCGAGGLIPAVASSLASDRVQEAVGAVERHVLAEGIIAAALGAFAAAVFLLPTVGVEGACYANALLSAIAVFILLLART